MEADLYELAVRDELEVQNHQEAPLSALAAPDTQVCVPHPAGQHHLLRVCHILWDRPRLKEITTQARNWQHRARTVV